MSDFDKNVFVNCPFDADYRQILLAILFTVKSLNYNPHMSLDDADCSDIRIQKITRLIEKCKIGIHDLSRIQAKKRGELYRMNMPFELGIDFAAKTLSHNKRQWKEKRILIIASERYEYHKALSDISGCDIKNHLDQPVEAIKAVRNWFLVTEKITPPPPSHTKIWNDFNDFNGYLAVELVKNGHKTNETADIPIPEVMSHYDSWKLTKSS